MEPMEPNYLQIEKDGCKIFFRVHIEKRFAYSEYYVRILDTYEIDFGSFLVVDDYQNIKIFNTITKEYLGFEVDELNAVYYFYEKLEFSGIPLEQVVKEILYQKFVGYGVDV